MQKNSESLRGKGLSMPDKRRSFPRVTQYSNCSKSSNKVIQHIEGLDAQKSIVNIRPPRSEEAHIISFAGSGIPLIVYSEEMLILLIGHKKKCPCNRSDSTNYRQLRLPLGNDYYFKIIQFPEKKLDSSLFPIPPSLSTLDPISLFFKANVRKMDSVMLLPCIIC